MQQICLLLNGIYTDSCFLGFQYYQLYKLEIEGMLDLLI